MYNQDTHTEVEGFILKWTLILVFVGVSLVFIVKILALLGLYITSGKIATDFAKYLWEACKKAVGLGVRLW